MDERRFEIEAVDLGVPMIFGDGSSAAALSLVDARIAQRLIDDSGFEIAEFMPGRGSFLPISDPASPSTFWDFERLRRRPCMEGPTAKSGHDHH
jgi:hypothetical protein